MEEKVNDIAIAADAATENVKVENIQVLLRVRPNEKDKLTANEMSAVQIDSQLQTCTVLDHSKNSIKKKSFTFDKVFTGASSQEEMFEAVDPLVVSAVNGFNATIFAYGCTGSGKTYTIQGNGGNPGIVPRAIHRVFQLAEDLTKKDPETMFMVHLEYVELYNNQFKDLLSGPDVQNNKSRNKVVVKELMGQASLVGCSSLKNTVTSAEEALKLIKQGEKRRAVGMTNCNDHSSRSHAILILHIECKQVCSREEAQIVKLGKLNIIDLAGSERVALSGAKGNTLIETQNINLSLTALGDVLSTLSALHLQKGRFKTKNPVIPYRNSKLTFLLKDSLGGNGRTIMIATIRTPVKYIQQTLMVLMYASRAKTIKNMTKIITDVHGQSKATALSREIETLKQQLRQREAEFERLSSREVLESQVQHHFKLKQLMEENTAEKKRLENCLKQVIHNHASNLASEQRKYSDLQDKLSHYELIFDQQRQEIATLRNSVRELTYTADEADIKETRKIVEDLVNALDDSRIEKKLLQAKVEDLKLQLRSANKQLENANEENHKRIEALETNQDYLKDCLEMAQLEKRSLEVELSSSRNHKKVENKDLLHQNSALKAENQELRQRCTDIIENVQSEVTDVLGGRDSQIELLENHLQSFKAEILSEKQKSKELSHEIVVLKKKNYTLQSALSKAEKDIPLEFIEERNGMLNAIAESNSISQTLKIKLGEMRKRLEEEQCELQQWQTRCKFLEEWKNKVLQELARILSPEGKQKCEMNDLSWQQIIQKVQALKKKLEEVNDENQDQKENITSDESIITQIGKIADTNQTQIASENKRIKPLERIEAGEAAGISEKLLSLNQKVSKWEERLKDFNKLEAESAALKIQAALLKKKLNTVYEENSQIKQIETKLRETNENLSRELTNVKEQLKKYQINDGKHKRSTESLERKLFAVQGQFQDKLAASFQMLENYEKETNKLLKDKKLLTIKLNDCDSKLRKVTNDTSQSLAVANQLMQFLKSIHDSEKEILEVCISCAKRSDIEYTTNSYEDKDITYEIEDSSPSRLKGILTKLYSLTEHVNLIHQTKRSILSAIFETFKKYEKDIEESKSLLRQARQTESEYTEEVSSLKDRIQSLHTESEEKSSKLASILKENDELRKRCKLEISRKAMEYAKRKSAMQIKNSMEKEKLIMQFEDVVSMLASKEDQYADLQKRMNQTEELLRHTQNRNLELRTEIDRHTDSESTLRNELEITLKNKKNLLWQNENAAMQIEDLQATLIEHGYAKWCLLAQKNKLYEYEKQIIELERQIKMLQNEKALIKYNFEKSRKQIEPSMKLARVSKEVFEKQLVALAKQLEGKNEALECAAESIAFLEAELAGMRQSFNDVQAKLKTSKNGPKIEANQALMYSEDMRSLAREIDFHHRNCSRSMKNDYILVQKSMTLLESRNQELLKCNFRLHLSNILLRHEAKYAKSSYVKKIQVALKHTNLARLQTIFHKYKNSQMNQVWRKIFRKLKTHIKDVQTDHERIRHNASQLSTLFLHGIRNVSTVAENLYRSLISAKKDEMKIETFILSQNEKLNRFRRFLLENKSARKNFGSLGSKRSSFDSIFVEIKRMDEVSKTKCRMICIGKLKNAILRFSDQQLDAYENLLCKIKRLNAFDRLISLKNSIQGLKSVKMKNINERTLLLVKSNAENSTDDLDREGIKAKSNIERYSILSEVHELSQSKKYNEEEEIKKNLEVPRVEILRRKVNTANMWIKELKAERDMQRVHLKNVRKNFGELLKEVSALETHNKKYKFEAEFEFHCVKKQYDTIKTENERLKKTIEIYSSEKRKQKMERAEMFLSLKKYLLNFQKHMFHHLYNLEEAVKSNACKTVLLETRLLQSSHARKEQTQKANPVNEEIVSVKCLSDGFDQSLDCTENKHKILEYARYEVSKGRGDENLSTRLSGTKPKGSNEIQQNPEWINRHSLGTQQAGFSQAEMQITDAALQGDQLALLNIGKEMSAQIARLSHTANPVFLPFHKCISGYHLHCSMDKTIATSNALIQLGFDVNSKDHNGNSALHKVLLVLPCTGVLPLMESLIRSGADVNCENTLGQTPLHIELLQLRRGSLGILKLLIDHGGDILHKSAKTSSPLEVLEASTISYSSPYLNEVLLFLKPFVKWKQKRTSENIDN